MTPLFLYKKISRTKLDLLIKKHRSDQESLDLGSGRSPYKNLFPNTISMDIHPDSGADIIGDALNIPLQDNQFEQVLCFELLEHVTNPQLCIDEIYRVLKPGGKLILSTRFLFSVHHAPHDYYRFTRYGLEHLLSKFENISIESETVNFETLGVLLQRIVFQSTFYLNTFFAIIFLIIAKVLKIFNFLIKEQFGQRNRSSATKEVIASGYFVVCYKPL